MDLFEQDRSPQKAAPSRRGSLRALRQIPSNGGLTDLGAEFEEFAVDMRRAPKRVVQAHVTDQVAYFVARLGAAQDSVIAIAGTSEGLCDAI